MTSSTTSPQVQLAIDVLEAYGNFDVAKAFSQVTEDYTHQMLPKSMFGEYIKSKAEMCLAIEKGLSALKKLRFDVYETIEAPGSVVIHSIAIGESKLGNAYENEYVFIFHTIKNEAGELKIKSCKEFIDSKYRDEYIKKEMAAMAALASKSQS